MTLGGLPPLPPEAGGIGNPGHDLRRKVEIYEQTVVALEALLPRRQSEKYFLRFDNAYYRHAHACGELLLALVGYQMAMGSEFLEALTAIDGTKRGLLQVLRTLAEAAKEWVENTGGWLTPMGIVVRHSGLFGGAIDICDDELGILAILFDGPGWKLFEARERDLREIKLHVMENEDKKQFLQNRLTKAHTRIIHITRDTGAAGLKTSPLWRMDDWYDPSPLWLDRASTIERLIVEEKDKQSPLNFGHWDQGILQRGARLGEQTISPKSSRTLVVLLALIAISLDSLRQNELEPFKDTVELLAKVESLRNRPKATGGNALKEETVKPPGPAKVKSLGEDDLRHALSDLRKKLVHPQLGCLLLEKQVELDRRKKFYCLHPTTILLLQLGWKQKRLSRK